MIYLLHRKKNDIYANISLFLSYSEVTVATRSGPYPAQMIIAVTRSSPYPAQMITVATRSGPYPAQMITAVTRSSPYQDQMITAVTRSSPYPDQMITAVTNPVRIQPRWSLSHQIQSVSRSDGGLAPRDNPYSSERQRRPGHLDEPQTDPQ